MSYCGFLSQQHNIWAYFCVCLSSPSLKSDQCISEHIQPGAKMITKQMPNKRCNLLEMAKFHFQHLPQCTEKPYKLTALK